MDEQISAVREAVIAGNAPETEAAVHAGLAAGLSAKRLLDEGLVEGMRHVGQLFEEGEYFVPEMLVAARAMKAGLAILRPQLMEAAIEPKGKVVIGTVRGDMHDIGKNLVGMMLEGAGFEIRDLGVNVAPERFVEVVQNEHPDIVALSALLTTTMPNMAAVIEQLKAAGVREQVKVLVGGAPVTESFAQRIGADGFAPDASQCATLASSLVS
ncbi:MAG: cobalamin-binding protein [Chloroflexi bacterium]|nr:MAG: cobalamin-binding protein [Chloroflexota bacterium]